jgi:hypothetical protein
MIVTQIIIDITIAVWHQLPRKKLRNIHLRGQKDNRFLQIEIVAGGFAVMFFETASKICRT